MIRAHRAAVVARLSPWKVVDDRSTYDDASMPAPWVVVDFPPPLRVSDRWEAPDAHRAVGVFQTSCVGLDSDQASALHEAVEARLLDWVPSVAGWVVWPVRMDSAPRMLPPYDAVPDRRLVTVVSRWSWLATAVP